VHVYVQRAIIVLIEKHVPISYLFQNRKLSILNMFLFMFLLMQVVLLTPIY
jgi:hypothetical protein